jgi:hypothetical protein
VLVHHRDDAFWKKGAPMIFGFRPVSAVDPAGHQQVGLDPSRREQVIAAFAASLAMLIVVAIAVLMGMA